MRNSISIPGSLTSAFHSKAEYSFDLESSLSFFSPADVAVLRWSYKHAREMLRRMDAYRGLFAGHHPKFPQGSEAANEFETNGPVDISAPDIVYTAEDDEAIDDYHKEFSGYS